MPNPQLEALGRVVMLLNAWGIGYCVGGSLASSYYGVSRTTADADIVVDLQPGQLDALATALEPEFYISRDAMRETLRERRSFNAIHLDTLFKVDFFVLGDGPFDREEFRRRVPKQLAELPDWRREFAEAEAFFTRIIERAPDFAEGWNKRATVRYLAERYAGAISDCEETLARNPPHFGALSGQGLCHMALGQYREAAVLFRRALDVHPRLTAARHNLTAALSEAVKGNGH